MKKLALLLAMTFSMCCVSGFNTAFADEDTSDLSYVYDFEDYNNSFSQGNMDGTGPDEKWTMYNGQKNFGSYTDGGNTAMKLGLNGGPALKLSRAVSTGNIRVSFDFKGSDGKLEKMLVRFMSDTDSSGTYAGTDYQAHMLWFNPNKDEKAYYFEKPNTWATVAYSGSCPMNQWHKAEIEITNFADGKATINYYLDKNKMNAEPISADMQAVEVLNFMVEANDGNWAGSDNRYFLIDNLKVVCSENTIGVGAELEKTRYDSGTAVISGSLVNVSPEAAEMIDSNTLVIADNEGNRIDGYTVSEVSADWFVVEFANALPDGSYKLILDESITGGLGEFSMPNWVEFTVGNPSPYLCEYDFEDYNSMYDTEKGKGPDSSWQALRGKSEFGATDDDGNRVMKINKDGEPGIQFGEIFEEGNVSVSFDVKFTGASRRLLTLFYDDAMQETHLSWINNAVNKFSYFEPTITNPHLGGWSTKPTTDSYDLTQWHTVEIVFKNIKDKSATVHSYVDGVKINEEEILAQELRGFSKLGFRTQTVEGMDEESFVYLDNVKVSRTYGKFGLLVNCEDEYIDDNKGSLNLTFPEVDDVDLLAKENVIITNTLTGNRVENFSLTNVSETGLTVSFNEVLQPGKYTLIFDDSVLDAHYKMPMDGSITFSTNIVAGDVNNVSLYDSGDNVCNGSEITSQIYKIEIDFNDVPNLESVCQKLKLGERAAEDVVFSAEVNENNGKVILTVDELLKPKTDYCLKIDSGIKMQSGALSKRYLEYNFSTLDDAEIRVLNLKNNVKEKKYSLTFSKNNTEQASYTFAVCGYKKVSKNDNGVASQVDELVGIKYVPVVLERNRKGVMEISIDYSDFSDLKDIRAFVRTWPSLNKVTLQN